MEMWTDVGRRESQRWVIEAFFEVLQFLQGTCDAPPKKDSPVNGTSAPVFGLMSDS
jgi:hypothetical protein